MLTQINTSQCTYQHTLIDQSWHKSPVCTTSIHWQTSADTNHQSMYYQHKLTDQCWHKSRVNVLLGTTNIHWQWPVMTQITNESMYYQHYTNRPVLTQITSQFTTNLHVQTSPDTNCHCTVFQRFSIPPQKLRELLKIRDCQKCQQKIASLFML